MPSLISTPYFPNRYKFIQKTYNMSPVFVQNIAASFWGYRIKRGRSGHCYKDYLERLKTHQWYDEEQLREIQRRKLRELIQYAYEQVPYYQELFRNHKLKPSDIQTETDLSKIPILKKAVIRRNWGALLAKNYPIQQAIKMTSSGTSGAPITVYTSPNCMQKEYAYRSMHYLWGKVWHGDRVAHFTGPLVVPIDQKKPPFWRYNWVDHQMFYSVRHISQNTVDEYVRALIKFKPQLIKGFPSAIYLIAKHVLKERIADIRPHAVFTASETLFDFQRAVIEEAFRTRVLNWYGNTELVAHATECECGGFHNQLLHSILEIVNEHGESIDTGTEGEVIGTSLDNWAMPLIRYQVGDLAIPESGKCACGRGYPLIRKIAGRTADYICATDGRFTPGISVAYIFNETPHIAESQLIQEELNLLRVQIVRDKGFSDEDQEVIRQNLRARLGDSMRVEFEYPTMIAREPSGKLKFLVNRLQSPPSDF